MKLLQRLIVFLLALTLVTCASIPSSTSTLTKQVISEADQMHQLNIALVQQLFDERQQQVNSFITNTYTPAILANYEKILPDSLDYKTELPNILKSIVPVINRKRDSIQGILDQQEATIIKNLTDNYTNYTQSTDALQDLIDSAVKLKSTESDVLSAIERFTGVRPGTVTRFENGVDSLLIRSGSEVDRLLNTINSIESTLNN